MEVIFERVVNFIENVIVSDEVVIEEVKVEILSSVDVIVQSYDFKEILESLGESIVE